VVRIAASKCCLHVGVAEEMGYRVVDSGRGTLAYRGTTALISFTSEVIARTSEACCFAEPPVEKASKKHHPASNTHKERREKPPQFDSLLRHAVGKYVPSHTDKQTSNRFSLTSSPSPSPTFDDPQGHGYRKGNPQQAPQQQRASGASRSACLPARIAAASPLDCSLGK
jgi:hypothetical protein